MGAIGGLFGTAGGVSGTGIAGPEKTPIVNPTNMNQIDQAYAGNQSSLTAQNQLLDALQQQNGLGNQTNVYRQLQGVASGTGPNPAQAMLSQATGANVANQAALMAGQRGASSNVGLVARQAAQQGATTQQQAANQAAVLQANQSLNALNSMGGLANTQVSNQIGQANANAQAQQGEQAALLNAQQGANASNVASQGNVNSANAGLANTTMQGQQATIGGLFQGVSGGLKALAGAEGGDVPRFDTGGIADPGSAFQGQSKFGRFLSGVGSTAQDTMEEAEPKTASGQLQKGTADMSSGLMGLLKSKSGGSGKMAGGPDLGGITTGAMAAKGGMTHDYRAGGKVNAKSSKEKAVKPGNDYANDKIPAVLSEHEIVIPRNVTMGKDPVGESAKFVAAVMAKRGRK